MIPRDAVVDGVNDLDAGGGIIELGRSERLSRRLPARGVPHGACDGHRAWGESTGLTARTTAADGCSYQSSMRSCSAWASAISASSGS